MHATRFMIGGSPVKLDDNGIFHVTIRGGEKIRSVSLQGLTRKVATALKFDDFRILVTDYQCRVTKDTVIGVSKSRAFAPPSFRTSKRSGLYRVILDNKENRAILKKMAALRKRERALEKQIDELDETLERRTPLDLLKVVKT